MRPNHHRPALYVLLLATMMLIALSACGMREQISVIHSLPTATAAPPTPTFTPRPTRVKLTPTVRVGTPVATPKAGTPTPKATPVVITSPFTGTDDLDVTNNVTVTVALSGTKKVLFTRPVALAIADYFHAPLLQVIELNKQGVSFGEIARAYFLVAELAADSNQANDMTPTQILALRQSNGSWGQVVMKLGLPPGNAGRDLGAITRSYHPPEQMRVVVPAPTAEKVSPTAVQPTKEVHKPSK